MNLTNKDIFNDIVKRYYQKETNTIFTKIDTNINTYFETVDVQPELMEYELLDKKQIDKYLDIVFDDSYKELKKICLLEMLRSISEIDQEERISYVDGQIAEYVYSF